MALLVTSNVLRKGVRYQYFIYSELVWLFGLITIIIALFAVFYLSPELMLFATYVNAVSLFFLLPECDSISREGVDTVKITLFAIITTLYVVVATYTPSTFWVEPFPDGACIGWNPLVPATFAYVIEWLVPNCAYFRMVYKMHVQAPRHLRKYSRLYLWGDFICTFLYPIGDAIVVPGIMGIQVLFIGVGVMMMAFTVALHPKLIFILPFRALRLTVIDTDSGIALFNHTWEDMGLLVDEDLYASMLQGVNLILKESINRGDMQEIKLDRAVVLAHRYPNYPITCVVTATKSSRTLRDALRQFAERFYEKFAIYFTFSSNYSLFDSAHALVEECFPFVPRYD